MPSDDGLGLDEDQRRPPPSPGGRQQHPKHAVTGAEVRPLHASLQGSQLVTEGQILEDHVVVATAGQGDRTQEQQRQFKHGLILSGMAGANQQGSPRRTDSGERQVFPKRGPTIHPSRTHEPVPS